MNTMTEQTALFKFLKGNSPKRFGSLSVSLPPVRKGKNEARASRKAKGEKMSNKYLDFVYAPDVVEKQSYHIHYCPTCGRDLNESKCISETGYYQRRVLCICPCGQHVEDYG